MKKIQKNAARFDNLKQDFLDDKKYSGTAEATLNGYRYDINSYSVSMSMEISPRSYLDNVARLLWIAGASLSNVIFRLCRNCRILFPVSILILDIAALRNHRFLCTENRITLLIEILLDLKPNVNFCEKMRCVFQTKTAYITNDAGGFLRESNGNQKVLVTISSTTTLVLVTGV